MMRRTLAIVAKHAFKDNISRLRQRFLLQIDDIFQGVIFSPTIERTSSRLCACGKIKRALSGKGPSKDCCTPTNFAGVAPFAQARRFMTGDDIYGGNRQQNLFANHLTQARGGTADSHVGDFSKRILFDLGKFACVNLHCAVFLRRKAAPDRNALKGSRLPEV